jgi:hypothetical protein
VAKRALLALLGAACAGAVAADWTPVAPDNGIYAAYADRSTIRRDGAIVRMSGMYDFAKGDFTPEGMPYYSTTTEREYDCQERRVRLIAYADHSQRFGAGAVVTATRGAPRRWEAIVEDSLDLAFWKIACAGA